MEHRKKQKRSGRKRGGRKTHTLSEALRNNLLLSDPLPGRFSLLQNAIYGTISSNAATTQPWASDAFSTNTKSPLDVNSFAPAVDLKKDKETATYNHYVSEIERLSEENKAMEAKIHQIKIDKDTMQNEYEDNIYLYKRHLATIKNEVSTNEILINKNIASLGHELKKLRIENQYLRHRLNESGMSYESDDGDHSFETAPESKTPNHPKKKDFPYHGSKTPVPGGFMTKKVVFTDQGVSSAPPKPDFVKRTSSGREVKPVKRLIEEM